MPTRPLRALSLPLTAALLAAPLSGTGCSSTAATPRGKVVLAGDTTIDHDAWKALGYRWDWTSRPPLIKGARIAFAEVQTDAIVLQDSASMVSVIEPSTGRVRWNTQASQTSTRFFAPVRRDDSLIVTNETDLYEFDLATGNTRDRTALGTIATTAPVMYDQIAVLGTAGGRLIAVDTKLDIRLWEYDFDGLLETTPTRVDDFTVAAISAKGQIRTLDVDDARTISSCRISGDASEPMVSDGSGLFIASQDQSLYGYETSDGSRIWRIRSSAPVTAQPVLIDGTLYATTADTGLLAVNADTGETLWTNRSIGGWVVTTSGGDLIVWNGRDLMRVDADRGDLISSTTPGGVVGIRSNTPMSGFLVAIFADGATAKFSPR